MRTFVAIDIADAVRARIEEVTRSLRGRLAGARWVPAGNLHLTLRFLGETSEPALAELRAGLAAAAGRSPAFELLYCGLGFFPSARRPRVFWVGVEDTPPALVAVQEEVEKLARGLGFEPETRSFSPHVTLARFKLPKPCPECERLANEFQDQVFGPSRSEFLTLYQSILSPAGARYQTLDRFPLSGSPG
jgi:2'-5' RNA ligase